jgi:hypothetical protein
MVRRDTYSGKKNYRPRHSLGLFHIRATLGALNRRVFQGEP